MAGRPRNTLATREPSGRVKRPTLAQLKAARQSLEDAEKAYVANQPHRRGSTSDLAGTALGRFILATKGRPECYDAANEYATIKSKWLAAWSAPRNVVHGGNGSDIPMEIVQEWGRRIADMENTMILAGGISGLGWVEDLAVYDRGEPQSFIWGSINSALLSLAVFCGRLDARHLRDSANQISVTNRS